MERPTPKKVVVLKAAVKKAAARSTRASVNVGRPRGPHWLPALSCR